SVSDLPPNADDYGKAFGGLLEHLLGAIKGPALLPKKTDEKRARAGLVLLCDRLPPQAREFVARNAFKAAEAANSDTGDALKAFLESVRSDISLALKRHAQELPSSDHELRQLARLYAIACIF